MMKKWGFVVAVFAVVAFAAGCSGGGASGKARATLEVTTKTMAFDTKEITLEKGNPTKLVLKNEDVILHDFSIDRISVDKKSAKGASHNEHSMEPDLHVAADAGKTGTLDFTPKEAGTYTYYCTVAGHKDAGMVGTLTVN